MTAADNEQIATMFYAAFANRDSHTMTSYYTADSTFFDPVFTDLKGEDISSMWTMLCQNGKDLILDYDILNATDSTVEVRWHAYYTFSKTGRKIHNVIHSRLEISDGKIANQVDSFSLYKWSRMAFGPLGFLLGWTPFFQNKIRQTAAAGLRFFQAKK